MELVAKGQTIEFGRNSQNEWQIIRPRPLRADGGQVEELVRRLTEARMDATVTDEDEKKAASSFSGATPAGVARTTDAAGTQQIEIRKDKEGSYYARSSAIEGVHRVASDVGVGLDKSLDDFRNKKLFDFGFSDPAKVEIRDGARQAAYQKLPDKWMSGSTQMDAATINAVVEKLRDLTAAKFVDSRLDAPRSSRRPSPRTGASGSRRCSSPRKARTSSPCARASRPSINWTPKPSRIFRRRRPR